MTWSPENDWLHAKWFQFAVIFNIIPQFAKNHGISTSDSERGFVIVVTTIYLMTSKINRQIRALAFCTGLAYEFLLSDFVG